MKNKRIVVISVFSIIVIFLIANIYIIFYKSRVYNNTKVNDEKYMSNLAIMLETKYNSGEYKASESSRWPATGYLFNSERSYCENGGNLDWNDATWSLTFHNNVTDKCYIYFDVEPPDVAINVNNLPDTYGKKGVITCNDGDITYNQQYNKVVINQVNTKYTNCTLNYEEQEDKVNFADYIMSLAGTTQGNGEVVNETANIPDYNSAVAIAESSYTSQSIFSSTSDSSTSGTAVNGVFTFANDVWTVVPSAMTSGMYYHFKFNPKENGYYQMCYELSAGNSNNTIYGYVNATRKNFDSSLSLSASSTQAKKGCIELGYVSSSDYIKIVQKAYTDISFLTFNIKKVNVVSSVDAGTRYEGKNPNNYVWFNNEYWRIIGVFDDASHGQRDKNLVKIIRMNILGGIEWAKKNVNNWSLSELNSLLNDAYYNAQDATGSDCCYGTRGIPSNCNYTKKGIQPRYRNLISNVTWYLGSYNSIYATPEKLYAYERGMISQSENSTFASGYVGLMYPSDYGYSVLLKNCARTTDLSSYSKCAAQNWLFGKAAAEWTLTPYSVDGNGLFKRVFCLYNYGNLSYYDVDYGYAVRPVIYLKEYVYKNGGDGTMDNPYYIGM